MRTWISLAVTHSLLATACSSAPRETTTASATPGIWRLRFITAMKGSGEDAKGQAFLEIQKSDKEHGNVKTQRIQRVGDRICWWPNVPGGPATSKHLVDDPAKPGRKVEVDFNTGMTLDAVEHIKYEGEIKKCKPKFGGGCEKTTEKVSIETTEIVYTDEGGKQVKIYHPDPKGDPRLRDRLCEHCSGKK